MNVRVRFLGASSEVTGSKYLLQIGDFNLLVDCGLFQGRKELRQLNWDAFPIDPSTLDAIVLTHAHLDHTGNLPRLFRQGCRAPIYCTNGTANLMELILMDSARIQEEDARYARKKGYSKHANPEPLYTTADIAPLREKVRSFAFGESVEISPQIHVQFFNAGHILGAAIVEITIRGDQRTKKIVFSGDLGRMNDPILFPPHIIREADILFVESTYGNRDVEQTGREEIIQVMNETFDAGGVLVVPAFSIGRTQTLLMYLKNVLMSQEIPQVKIFVDSPMAIHATAFYRKHQDCHKLRGIDLDEDESFLTLRRQLVICRTSEESRAINDVPGRAIIIAGNGMMSGGRVMHHLSQRLPNPSNTVLVAGYQGAGTRGKLLQDGATSIRIFGREIPVRARVFTITGLSAHADRSELLDWLDGFTRRPDMTFVVHGELDAAGALANALHGKGWVAKIPTYLETVELFQNI